MLAKVISHQPAQAWMISLTGLTAWAINLWSVLTTSTLGSVDNHLPALPSVLHHICSTRNPFDLRCESVTYNIVMYCPQNVTGSWKTYLLGTSKFFDKT